MPNNSRVAIVTGASNGIGAACAQRLSTGGYRVVIADLDDEAGKRTAGELPGSTFVRCDVTQREDVGRVVDTALQLGDGHLAVLVNNAGRTARTTFAELDEATWASLQETNLASVYRFVHASQQGLAAARGSIVNIASVAGLVGEEGLAGYSATKGAIIALTKSLALEFRGAIRVNAVCPGQINTRLMSRVTSNPELLAAVTSRIPAGRLGEPADVAEAVCWLASSASEFVNGVALPIDGGETAGITNSPL